MKAVKTVKSVMGREKYLGLVLGAISLILLSVLLWDSPSLAVFIFWWLKPAYERLPLYILSKALFGETPTLKQALREWPRLLKPQLLASLTWRRLSFSRSFLMPVVQLEGPWGNRVGVRTRNILHDYGIGINGRQSCR